MRQFLDNDDDLPSPDTDVVPNADHPEVAALPEVIPIHGADARWAFYNPTTRGGGMEVGREGVTESVDFA